MTTAILANNAALLAVAMLVLWAISARIRDVSFIDSFWAFGMAMLAVSTWLQAEGSPDRMALITGLTLLWGLRLSLHLFTRWRTEGEDPRYRRIIGHAMEKKGWSFARTALVQVFLLQGVLLFIVCLPAQLGQIPAEPARIGLLGWIGCAVALTGIAFETVGDWQLRRFRADPAMKGKVLDTGLWRYTRHPNYFGDACTWWGIWLVSAETMLGLYAVVGPVLEHSLKKRRPGYEDYIRRTSSFFPWPPRR